MFYRMPIMSREKWAEYLGVTLIYDKESDTEYAAYNDKDGSPALIIFAGKAQNPIQETYQTAEKRDRCLLEFLERRQKHLEYKTTEKIRRNAGKAEAIASVNVGDIFYSSWGYEQTNVCFYEVIAKNKSTATIRRIASTMTSAESWASGYCTACPGEYIDEEQKKRLIASYGNVHIKIDVCENAYPWDGNPKFFSTWG